MRKAPIGVNTIPDEDGGQPDRAMRVASMSAPADAIVIDRKGK